MINKPLSRLGLFSLAVGSLLLAAGFAHADSVQPKTSLSKKAVQLNVPFIKQEEPRDCGLAVLKMISAFYEQKLNQAQVDWIKTNSQAGEGVMASELIVVLKAAGFETALYPGTLNKESTGLYRQLDKERPLIIMITAKDGKSSHYDIVTGYDPDQQLLLLLDPAIGPLTVPAKDFEAAWKRAKNFTLLAVPKKLLEKKPTPSH